MRQLSIDDGSLDIRRLIEEVDRTGESVRLLSAGRPVADVVRPKLTRQEAFELVERVRKTLPPITHEEIKQLIAEGRA